MLRLVMIMVMVLMMSGCAAEVSTVFAEKYRAMFRYDNIVLADEGEEEVLNIADYNAFKSKLNAPGCVFDSQADNIANLCYAPEIQTSPTGVTQTEFIESMDAARAYMATACQATADRIYDAMVSAAQPNGGSLTKATVRAFEACVGSLTTEQANAYLDLLTDTEIITKDHIGNAFCAYLTDETVTVSMMPLYGPGI